MDVVGGFELADGRRAKALTGVDDHSRYCVCAYLMVRETAPRVCDGLVAAMRAYGVPEEILTDNGKVFTGRFNHPPVEVLFDRICRENGIIHRLTEPRSPTTTGKVERFHRTLRGVPHRPDLPRPGHRTGRTRRLGERLQPAPTPPRHRHGPARRTLPAPHRTHRMSTTLTGVIEDRTGDDWIARRAGSNGVICVSWQQICLGKAAAGHNVDVHVTSQLLHIWDGRQLLKTVPRTTQGDVRKKHASIPRNQH